MNPNVPNAAGTKSAWPPSEPNERPLVWPDHFPPTGRRDTFFNGVRGFGPDISFFKALKQQQMSRTEAALDLWTEPHERSIAAALGKVLQRELGWKTPWFIPNDALHTVFGGPSFDAWNESDPWDVFIELDRELGLNKGPEFWSRLIDWEDDSLVLGHLASKMAATLRPSSPAAGRAKPAISNVSEGARHDPPPKDAGDQTTPILCRGDAWDMGLSQGEALKSRIASLLGELKNLEPFRLQQPCWLPYTVYRHIAERKASRYLLQALSKQDPAMWARIRAIALGAGVNSGSICLMNAMEPMLSSVGGCITCGHACSAVAVRGSRSSTGEPIIARNFEYLSLVQPYHIVRESRPTNALASLQFTVAPVAGAIDGVNEAGLCITYDYAFALDVPPAPAPSISMIISGALERCRTVSEAADYISNRPRWGAGILMLADDTGDLASLELSGTRSWLRRPSLGDDHLFHTNRFRGVDMKAVEAPLDAVLDKRAPRALRGRRVHESAERRDARWSALLAGAEPYTVEQLASLLADHGPEGKPSDYTPCVHGDYWNTTTCMQLLPRSRTIRIAFDRPCKAKYREWSL